MSMDDTCAGAIAQAEEDGLKVVRGDDNTLQLDIDTMADLLFAKSMLPILEQRFKFSNVTVTRSKSNRWHLYVHLKKPLDRKSRILLQACLGSDRKRELLNYFYFRDGGDGDCLFFEKPDAKHELLEV